MWVRNTKSYSLSEAQALAGECTDFGLFGGQAFVLVTLHHVADVRAVDHVFLYFTVPVLTSRRVRLLLRRLHYLLLSLLPTISNACSCRVII